MVFNVRTVSIPESYLSLDYNLVFYPLCHWQVLASVLFSLAFASALAQTDIQCNDTGNTGDCSQFINKFCADVATVKVSSSPFPRLVYITQLVISEDRSRDTKRSLAVTQLLGSHVCLPLISNILPMISRIILTLLLCSGQLAAYNTHDASGNPSKVNCGKVLNKVSKTCPKACLFHV